MKKLLATLLIALPLLSFGANMVHRLPKDVHHNAQFDFIPHHGEGPFGTYLTMEINYKPMKYLFDQVNRVHPRNLKNRGEAHITVITPVEYNKVLRPFVSMKEIDQIAQMMYIQQSQFQVVCLGRGVANLNGKREETFYVVVKSEDLLDIRRQVRDLFVARGGDARAFNPEHFFPHITLGFTARDLHESNGVIKNSRSCVARLTE